MDVIAGPAHDSLTRDPEIFMHWGWQDLEPHYGHLVSLPLTASTLAEFLQHWSELREVVSELQGRLYVATTRDTADEAASARYHEFLDATYPNVQRMDQSCVEKLLESGLEPEGFEQPLRKMRVQAALFREQNVPLLGEDQKLGEEYDQITGAQTVKWRGEEVPISRMRGPLQDPDRSVREEAWRLTMQRQLADREAINDLWRTSIRLRRTLAENAALPDYRAYRWQEYKRVDYSVDDALRLHQAIEEVVVPAVARVHERRRRLLGVDALRPWDVDVDPLGRPPLRPFSDAAQLEQRTSALFQRLDPELGSYFDTMARHGLLDLESRANKAPGGYCYAYAATGRPFIFMNASGTQYDVETLVHESGHAFHFFEILRLPYEPQREPGLEFLEVASMAMEYLTGPFLGEDDGGFYSAEDAARARSEHLERSLFFWSRCVVIDAFQHWAHTHPDEAGDPAACDAYWLDLWRRMTPSVDWSGLDTEAMTGWHRVVHIHAVPFYMIEYALAQLGAVQIWANALRDQSGAMAAYRYALSLGDTRSIPDLYHAAGARFAFDSGTLRAAVDLMENTLSGLSST